MKHYDGNDRYQFQPWYVKAYRQCKYRPIWIACMAWAYLKWIAWHRMAVPDYPPGFYRSRWHVALQSYRIWQSLFECWIGYHWTMQEAFKQLREENQ